MIISETSERPFDIDDCMITAFNATRSGSSRLLDAFAALLNGRWDGPPSDGKGAYSDSEREIRRILYECYPEHPVYVGESPPAGDPPGLFWRADPLDGTGAFLRGSPFFAVSLSLLERSPEGEVSPLIGVTLAPALMEMFWAVKGAGAFLCRQVPGTGICEGPVSVSDCGRPESSSVKTGVSGGVRDREGSSRILESVRAFSAEESVSLALAYVAGGRADAFFQKESDPWLTAAGALMVTEAGGRATRLDGSDFRPGEEGGILATNGLLHRTLSTLVNGG
jgi:fructose-1,6-bisphosphatase/inositol monophosphatase family enzyme